MHPGIAIVGGTVRSTLLLFLCHFHNLLAEERGPATASNNLSHQLEIMDGIIFQIRRCAVRLPQSPVSVRVRVDIYKHCLPHLFQESGVDCGNIHVVTNLYREYDGD